MQPASRRFSARFRMDSASSYQPSAKRKANRLWSFQHNFFDERPCSRNASQMRESVDFAPRRAARGDDSAACFRRCIMAPYSHRQQNLPIPPRNGEAHAPLRHAQSIATNGRRRHIRCFGARKVLHPRLHRRRRPPLRRPPLLYLYERRWRRARRPRHHLLPHHERGGAQARRLRHGSARVRNDRRRRGGALPRRNRSPQAFRRSWHSDVSGTSKPP